MVKDKIETKKPVIEKKPLTLNAYLHFLYALVFPGLGHILLGKARRGIFFFFSIITFFVLGLRLNGYLPILGERPGWLAFLAVLTCASAGVPYFIALNLILFFGMANGNPTSLMEPYGNYFLIAAGLLNIIVALDAMDIAAGRKE